RNGTCRNEFKRQSARAAARICGEATRAEETEPGKTGHRRLALRPNAALIHMLLPNDPNNSIMMETTMKRSLMAILLLLCLTAIASYAQEKPAAKTEAKPATGDAQARAKQILEAAQQAKGPLDKLKAAHDYTSRANASISTMGQSFEVNFTIYTQS